MNGMQKILEEIEKHKHIVTIFGREVYFVPLETVKQIIHKHMNDGWIPVGDRLPEDGIYLCTLEGELCGIEEPFTGMCGIENGIWDEPDCVTAWQPLPEPYQAEK